MTAKVVIQLPGSCLYTVIWRQKSSSRGWGALTHFYFLSSLKRRFICFMITSVPFSMIISVIKWSSVKIYVWSAFFFWCLCNTLAEKVYFPLLFLFINSRLIVLSIRNGLAEHSEEQAKKVPNNEIARNKICTVDILNGHEWRKVGCVVENKLEFRH